MDKVNTSVFDNLLLQCLNSINQDEDRDLSSIYSKIRPEDSYEFIAKIESFIKQSANKLHRARAFKLLDDFTSSAVINIPSYINEAA